MVGQQVGVADVERAGGNPVVQRAAQRAQARRDAPAEPEEGGLADLVEELGAGAAHQRLRAVDERGVLEPVVDEGADQDADDDTAAPEDRLRALTAAFVDYGLEYPAFVDCALELMRRTGPELLDEISEGAMYRLGRGISTCLAMLAATIQAGVEAGVFHTDDVDLLANTLYASGLGGMQLARVGMLVKQAAPGVPTTARLPAGQVKEHLIAASVAMAVGAR